MHTAEIMGDSPPQILDDRPLAANIQLCIS